MRGVPKTCLRCGKPLPAGCSSSRQYCDDCGAERNRERTRERMRKERIHTMAVMQTKAESADRRYCKPCIYYGSDEYGKNLCDFLIITGHRRGCKAGVGCEQRIIGKAMKAKRKGA